MCACYSYDADESKFTGKERDSESGLDHFQPKFFAHLPLLRAGVILSTIFTTPRARSAGADFSGHRSSLSTRGARSACKS